MSCRCRAYVCLFRHILLFEKGPSLHFLKIIHWMSAPFPSLYRQFTIFYRWIFGIAFECFIAFVFFYFPTILFDRQHSNWYKSKESWLISIDLCIFQRLFNVFSFIFFFQIEHHFGWSKYVCIQYSCTIPSVRIWVPLQITLLLFFVCVKMSYARSLLVFLIRFYFIFLFHIHVLFHV